jgi:hypothetical protein
MSDLDERIDSCIRRFTDDVGRLARLAAIEAVARTLSGKAAPPSAKSAPAPARATAAVAKPAAGPTGERKLGQKRPPAEIEATGAKLEALIRQKPGQRIETIGAALGIPTRQLALPVKKLLAAGKLKKRGQKRSTQYFPAG